MVIIKSDEEIEIMRKCGRILAAILDKLRAEVRPGIKTRQLDFPRIYVFLSMMR